MSQDEVDLTDDARKAVLELMLVRGLYASVSTEGDLGESVVSVLQDADVGTFDCYCITCKRETPFLVRRVNNPSFGGATRNNNAERKPIHLFNLISVCQRNNCSYIYIFRTISKKIVKIGQWPSMADIAFSELKGIEKTLEPQDRSELGKALGLFAHDSALGAFTYLRRVFERMIARAHERQAAAGNPIDGFASLKMDQKIAALKSELPARVVEQSKVFSVLSIGMHELSDEQCLAIFPLVKALIFQMLEHEEHQRKRATAERETDAALQAFLSSGMGSQP